MDMTPDRWMYTERYLQDVFGGEDAVLAAIREDAAADELPDIAISSSVGRLLGILTSMTRGELALEVGTLGGYSGVWIARNLAPNGRLITIELDPHHAEVAERSFARANLEDRVDVRRGAALSILPELARELGPESLDVVFFDAEKTEYPEYWRLTRDLIRVGGLLIADNVLGSSSWWIDQERHPQRAGADRLNRDVVGDGRFEATAVPLRQGVLIARRTR